MVMLYTRKGYQVVGKKGMKGSHYFIKRKYGVNREDNRLLKYTTSYKEGQMYGFYATKKGKKRRA